MEKISKSDFAHYEIMKLISTGELGRNSSFFSEQDIVDRIGVSRTPVRTALAKLASDGIVEVIPQIGVRIKPFDDDDLREIFLLRQTVEPYCSIRFCERCKADRSFMIEKVHHLDLLTHRMEWAAEKGDVDGFLEQDTLFHAFIARSISLSLMTNVIEKIGERIRLVGFVSTPDEASMRVVVDEHREISSAFKNVSTKKAEKATLSHITNTKKRLEEGHRRKIFQRE